MTDHPAPPFSVVIPARGMAAILHQKLPGVLSQTFRPLEVIVVDSASTD